MTNLQRALEGREEALNRAIPPLPYKFKKHLHSNVRVLPHHRGSGGIRTHMVDPQRLEELIKLNRSGMTSYVNEELKKLCLP